MAQRPKEHVREAIVAAASATFAEAGYEATTIAAVAERASTSVGNVYRYFGGKEELFAAVLPEAFAADLRRMTRRRIVALGKERDIVALAPDARYHVVAGELLDHCLANRDRVVILLAKARGTPFESFAGDFEDKLVAWALEYARGAWPEVRPSATLRFALGQVYANYLASLAHALSAFPGDAQVREAIAHLTAHHQGGLRHLLETAAGSPPRRRR